MFPVIYIAQLQLDQLEMLANQVKADFFPIQVGQQPREIATASLEHARRHHHDVMIMDTAGRLGYR